MKRKIEETDKQQTSFASGNEYERLREFLVKQGITTIKTIQNDQMMIDWVIGTFIKMEIDRKERERVREAYYSRHDGMALEIKLGILEGRMKIVEENLGIGYVVDESKPEMK